MKIAVIGGGAAGMMCAATINESDDKSEVYIIERNESLGKKVIISGGGRCNITTGIENVREVLTKYPRGSKFLSSAMFGFSPSAVRMWFEAHGIPLKCEKDLRVFPVSNNGQDVVNEFENILKIHKTKILYGHRVKEIKKINNEFIIIFEDQPQLVVDRVALTVGGQAYRKTGSNGDGYGLAESLGHKITALAASLHSFIILEKWPTKLAGISFEKAKITAANKYSFTGPFLFTHSGLSGPAIFALSSLSAFVKFNKNEPMDIIIDFLPDVTIDELYKIFKNKDQENIKKSFKNYLRAFVPEAVAEVACLENGIEVEKKYAVINNEELQNTAKWIKGAPLKAIGKGSGDEFVTAGGVDLSEVDPFTMESKICKGLYFAGEILDVDGFTGGFNLQASWATGRRAGENIYK
jgi:predicted Rossmann fold flavoprotein